ncbi:MAG TPA: DUF5695 domain-containing protein [Gemmatimonadaceae bacterium]
MSRSEDASPPVSRRGFLQTAGAVGAQIALGDSALARMLPDVDAKENGRPVGGPADSQFAVEFDGGAIASLRRVGDAFDTNYVRPRGRLGDVTIRYRRPGGEWRSFETAGADRERRSATSADGASHESTYTVSDGEQQPLQLKIGFTVERETLRWTLAFENLSDVPIEIGDLAVPLPMNTRFGQRGQPPTAAALKHCLVARDGSFFFWMRKNSVGPYLTMTPAVGTQLEYWEPRPEYRAFVHSVVAGAEASSRGCKWRQPHTSATLEPLGERGHARSYGFDFHWAPDYDGVRQLLVDQRLIDVQVVPGMTVPVDLFARVALRTKEHITALEAEFPDSTTIRKVGSKGDTHLYDIRFSRLGENLVTVRFGKGRRMSLEFFCTEPLETLIAKRAAFIAGHQHRDPSKWYDGLLAEWNMESHVTLGPDNYDRIQGWRIYEVTCDDPGLSKPAFLASKNAEYPVQAEVSALDYYIDNFVWGGLQRTTDEIFEYGIYGIPDWKTNRESTNHGPKGRQHLWRIYDYPHVTLMYFGMYRVAKHHPEIRTALSAEEYLKRAYGTAVAMFTVPLEITRWSAYETGLYNELVIVELIRALEDAGMEDRARRLKIRWERKVRTFVRGDVDLFRSEYAFDSTGFESTHALAKYAMEHVDEMNADNLDEDDGRSPKLSREGARKFMDAQMAANLFCRGTIEPAYYYLGSDYRGGGGDRYTLTYMSQMGGWSVLDYGLSFASDPAPYLRLGYQSYLSAWALLNSGTPESNYGYWYPGAENDGGAGGGFEPAPYGTTWLEQPHHRGSWYYSCEIDLGFCGALRAAATVLTDDPIFGRFCLGGNCRRADGATEVTPKDGVRRRFHAVLDTGRLHMVLDRDRFASSAPIVLADDLSSVTFALESDTPTPHPTTIRLSGLPKGTYNILSAGNELLSTIAIEDSREAVLELPVHSGSTAPSFSISRA